MTSEQARERMSDALEGALDPDTMRAFEAALDADPELRREWEALRAVVRGAAELGAKTEDAAPPPQLLRGVQARLRRRSRGRFYRDRFAEQAGTRSSFAVLAALLVALLLAVTWVAARSIVVIEPPAPPAARP